MTKKNYDYIAAVEKAISEKYGKGTAQDFRSQWDADQEKDYLEQLTEARKSKETKRPQKNKQDRTCPVCKTYSFSGRDDLYMNRFKCCYFCYVDFVHQNPEEWLEGKRPTEQDKNTILRRRKYGHGARDN